MEVSISEDHQNDESVIDSVANATPPPASVAHIHKVPITMVQETGENKKNYVPKVVSIGPFHFGEEKLQWAEKQKPYFAMKLLENDKGKLTRLYKKLVEAELVEELRNFYEEKATNFSDKVFTKMMLLDGCFILYYILYIFGDIQNMVDLNFQQFGLVYEDLFLLENQIPFKVLRKVMKFVNHDWDSKIKVFIGDTIMPSWRPKRRWFYVQYHRPYVSKESKLDFHLPDHLLHLLHLRLTKKHKVPGVRLNIIDYYRGTMHSASELLDAGINLEPSNTMSLTHIEFSRAGLFSANLKLPPIVVDDSTKTILLNLIAYERCCREAHDSWVTSYVCFIYSLINQPEDVKALRKAMVLDNSLGSDNDVEKLFKEIGTHLVPNPLNYIEAMVQIQHHYDNFKNVNTSLSELKHDYMKNHWQTLALVGAGLALFLTAVQTYYTVWSLKGECDDLCMFLKMNHHL